MTDDESAAASSSASENVIDISTSTTQCFSSESPSFCPDIDDDKTDKSDFNIAAKAAQVATAAKDAQSNAAECAANQVKFQLAEKAIKASNAVQTVLECKRALVDKLKMEMSAADAMSNHLGNFIQTSECNAQRVDSAFKSAESQFKQLLEIENSMRHSVSGLSYMGKLAQTDFNAKRHMLIGAKERADRLQKQLDSVRNEYEKVKVAAYQAACAAVEARQKADSTSDHNCHSRSRSHSYRRQQRNELHKSQKKKCRKS
ncbi:uncharacterized protein LOC117793818 [Drosophila innubila]|uniref:uncharacterized protein LOC117793818 n=1 Tax=Drosophila innubila TaxID=198719 RepID=UPI00148D907B|nr:uncharacterized protein LOC117793818 [Drosophila innubila]